MNTHKKEQHTLLAEKRNWDRVTDIVKMTDIFQVAKYKKACSTRGLGSVSTEACPLKKQGAIWQG